MVRSANMIEPALVAAVRAFVSANEARSVTGAAVRDASAILKTATAEWAAACDERDDRGRELRELMGNGAEPIVVDGYQFAFVDGQLVMSVLVAEGDEAAAQSAGSI